MRTNSTRCTYTYIRYITVQYSTEQNSILLPTTASQLANNSIATTTTRALLLQCMDIMQHLDATPRITERESERE